MSIQSTQPDPTPHTLSVDESRRVLELVDDNPSLHLALTIMTNTGIKAVDLQQLCWGDVWQNSRAPADQRDRGTGSNLASMPPGHQLL